MVPEVDIRAAQHGYSSEEHRQILPVHGSAGSLKVFLLEMPDVGDDREFAR